MSGSIRLCRLDDIEDGKSKGFQLARPELGRFFLVRRGGRVFAYRDECPHEHTPLAWRRDEYLSADGTTIVCFGHGAEFDVATGLCTQGPCVGQSLVAVPVAIDADGYLIVTR